ncbi:hypothetical protein H0H92_001617 [Tricholoma furcatifolium]|nr:hypothetical protein H0H92_001617 [Tricholoma furcatifolium]
MHAHNIQNDMVIAIPEYHRRFEQYVRGDSNSGRLLGMPIGDDGYMVDYDPGVIGDRFDTEPVDSYDSNNNIVSSSDDDTSTISSSLSEVPVAVTLTAGRLTLRSATQLTPRLEAISPEKSHNIYGTGDDTSDEASESAWPRKALTIKWLKESEATQMFERFKNR